VFNRNRVTNWSDVATQPLIAEIAVALPNSITRKRPPRRGFVQTAQPPRCAGPRWPFVGCVEAVLRPWHGEWPFHPAGRVPHIATLAGRHKRGGIRQQTDRSIRRPRDRVVRQAVGHRIRQVTDGRVGRPMDRVVRQLTDREVRPLTDSSPTFPRASKMWKLPALSLGVSVITRPGGVQPACRAEARLWSAVPPRGTAFPPRACSPLTVRRAESAPAGSVLRVHRQRAGPAVREKRQSVNRRTALLSACGALQ
jgi:hypothetical protein